MTREHMPMELQDSILDVYGGMPPRHPTVAARHPRLIGLEMGGGPGGVDRWWLTSEGEARAEQLTASFRVWATGR